MRAYIQKYSNILRGIRGSNLKRGTRAVQLIAVASVLALQSVAIITLSPSRVFAVGEEISGGSNTTGDTDSYIPLTGISVSGAPGDTVPVSLSVDRGQLSMTTTTGLSFTTGPTGNILVFEGTVSNVNAALATLRYKTVRAETVTFAAQLTAPGEVFFPGNGHLYEVVEGPGSAITADDARIAAAARTKYGASGYLATVTTQAENDYIGPRLTNDGWFGASDAATEDDWKWITGPETGTSFWSGQGANNGGTPVSGRYSNWASGEPNDSSDNEDCAQFYASGSGWNDLPCTGANLQYYVVEYGAAGDLPEVSSTSFTITTEFPEPNDIPIATCLDLIDVAADMNNHRYDNLNLTADIDCTGESLEPMFTDDDPDFGPLSFRGTFDGQGNSITGLTLSEASDINVGLISRSNGATIQDIELIGGEIEGEECVGGLVGDAVNTTFLNVTSSADVIGDYDVGGIVGCLTAEEGDSEVTDSTVSSTVRAVSDQGGLVGSSWTVGEQTTNFQDNVFSGELANDNESEVGGIVGSLDAEDGASVNLEDNSANGFDLEETSQAGGFIGEVSLGDDSTMTATGNTLTGDIHGNYSIGGIIGEVDIDDGSSLTIADTIVSRNITGEESYIGGLIGELYMEGDEETGTMTTISDSSVTGDISGGGSVGGLIGESYRDYGYEVTTIENSFTTGDITGTDYYVGGLMGYVEGALVGNTYATGAISGDGSVGGLFGSIGESIVGESYATGTVTAQSEAAGGLIGDVEESYIAQNYATGDVVGTNDVGGLVGNAYYDTLVEDSYARGDVDGDNYVGSLVGNCEEVEIDNSYATGLNTGTSDAGGLIGIEADCTTTNSFWDADTTGLTTSASGTAKTTEEMKLKATFTDLETDGLDESWDFAAVWGIVASVNDGYPCLLWQDEACIVTEEPAEDEDGIPSAIEDAAPNGGDANNDGTPDSEQPNVASFVNDLTEAYTTIELPQACQATQASVETEASEDTQDAGYNYQSGLVRFAANCGTPGYTATIKVYQYGVTMSGLVLRKYNPNTNAYFTITSALLAQTAIGGQTVTTATYDITDGGELDTDSVVNGIIVDPVGLAATAVGAPNTGLGGGRP